MLPFFDMTDWYWIVGGSGPHVASANSEPTGDDSRVFSSKRNAYVPADDEEYQRWLAEKQSWWGFNPTTRIDTEANLAEVLKPYNIEAKF